MLSLGRVLDTRRRPSYATSNTLLLRRPSMSTTPPHPLAPKHQRAGNSGATRVPSPGRSEPTAPRTGPPAEPGTTRTATRSRRRPDLSGPRARSARQLGARPGLLGRPLGQRRWSGCAQPQLRAAATREWSAQRQFTRTSSSPTIQSRARDRVSLRWSQSRNAERYRATRRGGKLEHQQQCSPLKPFRGVSRRHAYVRKQRLPFPAAIE